MKTETKNRIQDSGKQDAIAGLQDKAVPAAPHYTCPATADQTDRSEPGSAATNPCIQQSIHPTVGSSCLSDSPSLDETPAQPFDPTIQESNYPTIRSSTQPTTSIGRGRSQSELSPVLFVRGRALIHSLVPRPPRSAPLPLRKLKVVKAYSRLGKVQKIHTGFKVNPGFNLNATASTRVAASWPARNQPHIFLPPSFCQIPASQAVASCLRLNSELTQVNPGLAQILLSYGANFLIQSDLLRPNLSQRLFRRSFRPNLTYADVRVHSRRLAVQLCQQSNSQASHCFKQPVARSRKARQASREITPASLACKASFFPHAIAPLDSGSLGSVPRIGQTLPSS
jgi:hypothetical protein